MRIKDLIKKLEKYNDDLTVILSGGSGEDSFYLLDSPFEECYIDRGKNEGDSVDIYHEGDLIEEGYGEDEIKLLEKAIIFYPLG